MEGLVAVLAPILPRVPDCRNLAHYGVVGDWALATYWGSGPLPKPPVIRDSDRWAARVGWVLPDLWQLDAVQKYGFAVPDFAGQSQVLGVVSAYDVLVELGDGPLLPGFNYVMTHLVRMPPEAVGAPAPPIRPVLERAADLIGAGGSAVIDAGPHPMLCLRRPVRLTGSAVSWQVSRDPGVPAEVEALALALPRGGVLSCLVGLWSPRFGYLHTGEISVDVAAYGYWRATVRVELTGEHNDVTGTITGPFMGSLFFQFSPAHRPGNPWPFGET